MAMSKEHEKALVHNRVQLVKNLIINEDLLSYMMAEKSILTDQMKEEIQTKATRGDKIGKLLDILKRRGPDAMSVFIFALVYTDQEGLARLLDREIADKYEKQRNLEKDPDYVPYEAMEVDSGTSEETEKTLEEKLADIQAGNDNLLATVRRLNSSDPFVGVLCRQMKLKSVYNVRSNVRGRAVIFSWHHFVPSKLPSRYGNEKDVDNLKKLFGQHLQFEVEVFNDLFKQDFDRQIEKERSSEKLKSADMFVLIVLSHGTDGSFFELEGKSIRIDDVVSRFDGKNCPALSDKPKLFFIQACQGDQKTTGALLQTPTESGKQSHHEEESFDFVDAIDPNPLPSSTVVGAGLQEKADQLIGKASVSGFQANRNTELGTLYIRCIVYVFSRKAHKDHVEDMLVEVANIMSAFKTQKNEVFCSKKEGTLRKKLYFMPGFDGQC